MSYVYVRKDLSHIERAQEQTLLKAFLTALYDPEFIGLCVDNFAFTAVPEEVRQIGLDGINMLTTLSNATDWTFESSTTPGDGQGDYVISGKRRSFAEYQRKTNTGETAHLQTEIDNVRAELQAAREKIRTMTEEVSTITQQAGGSTLSSAEYSDFTEDDAGKVSASLIMSSISMVLWALAAGVVAFRMFNHPNKDVTGSHDVANGSGTSSSAHGANGTMTGGSGHGAAARSAAKHSAMTQDSDMVA